MLARPLVLVLALVSLPGCATAVSFARLQRAESVPPRGADAVRTPDGVVHLRAHYPDAPSRGFIERGRGWERADAGALPAIADRVPICPDGVPADGIVLDEQGDCRLVALGETVASTNLSEQREAPAWRQTLPWVLLPVTLGVDVATLPLQATLLIAAISDRGLIGGLLP